METVELENAFDGVNISNMLHHVEDKKAAPQRFRKALKDDGKLVIVEPNYYYPPRWIIETDFLDSINLVKYLGLTQITQF